MAKKGRKRGRGKVRIIRRDRFGRFNPRGRTVQRIKAPVRRVPKPRPQAEPIKPPRGAVSLVDELHPQGRYAFLARDQRPDVADMIGRDKLTTAVLTFAYTDPKTGKKEDFKRTISWDSGEDEEEFWDNYADAVRDELESVVAEAESETSGRYSKFAIAVTYMM